MNDPSNVMVNDQPQLDSDQSNIQTVQRIPSQTNHQSTLQTINQKASGPGEGSLLEDTRSTASYIRHFWIHRTNEGYQLNNAELTASRNWLKDEFQSFAFRPLMWYGAAYFARYLSNHPMSQSISQYRGQMHSLSAVLILWGTFEAIRGPLDGYDHSISLIDKADPNNQLAIECRTALRKYHPKSVFVADFDRKFPKFDQSFNQSISSDSLPPPVQLNKEASFFLKDYLGSNLRKQIVSNKQSGSQSNNQAIYQSNNQTNDYSTAPQPTWPSDRTSRPSINQSNNQSINQSNRQPNNQSKPSQPIWPVDQPFNQSNNRRVRRNEFGDEILEDDSEMRAE